MFHELFAMHNYCLNHYGQPGIYIGATENKHTNKLTYSGSVITNKFLYTSIRLQPNNTFQKVDLGNAILC